MRHYTVSASISAYGALSRDNMMQLRESENHTVSHLPSSLIAAARSPRSAIHAGRQRQVLSVLVAGWPV
ncbi:hypothetical protein C8R44DRAFT_793046, partial [Mycena epipterygia]